MDDKDPRNMDFQDYKAWRGKNKRLWSHAMTGKEALEALLVAVMPSGKGEAI